MPIISIFKRSKQENPGEYLGEFELIDPQITTLRQFLGCLKPQWEAPRLVAFGLMSFFIYAFFSHWEQDETWIEDLVNTFILFVLLIGTPLFMILIMSLFAFKRRKGQRAKFYLNEIHYKGKKMKINTSNPTVRFSPNHLLVKGQMTSMVRIVHTNAEILDHLHNRYYALSLRPEVVKLEKTKTAILLVLLCCIYFFARE